jgi:protein HIRA/HIR1
MVCLYELRTGSGGSILGGDINVENWRTKHVLRGHANNIMDLSWSPDSTKLATVSLDNTVLIWDAATGARLATLNRHTSFVKGVAWDPIGTYLATQAEDKTVIIWRTEDWTVLGVIKTPFKRIVTATFGTRMSWSPDGQALLIGNSHQGATQAAVVVARGKWEDTKNYLFMSGHQGAIVATCFNPKLFRLPQPANNNNNGTKKTSSNNNNNKEEEAPLSSLFALGSQDKQITVWAAAIKRPLFIGTKFFKSQVLDLAWTPDGYSLLVSGSDGTLALLQFGQEDIGVPATSEEVAEALDRLYGVNRGQGKRLFAESADVLDVVPIADGNGHQGKGTAIEAAGGGGLDARLNGRLSGGGVGGGSGFGAGGVVTQVGFGFGGGESGPSGTTPSTSGFGAPVLTAVQEAPVRKKIAAVPVGAGAGSGSATIMMPPPPSRTIAATPPSQQQQQPDAKRARLDGSIFSQVTLPTLKVQKQLEVYLGKIPPPPPPPPPPHKLDNDGITATPTMMVLKLINNSNPKGRKWIDISCMSSNGTGDGGNINSTLQARGRGGMQTIKWTDTLPGAAVTACGNLNFSAIGLSDGHVIVHSAAGRQLWPAMKVGPGIVKMTCSNNNNNATGTAWKLLILTGAGRVRVLDVHQSKSLLNVSALHILTPTDHNISSKISLLDARLSEAGLPLLTFSNNKVYAWSTMLEEWMAVVDGNAASASQFMSSMMLGGNNNGNELRSLQAQSLRTTSGGIGKGAGGVTNLMGGGGGGLFGGLTKSAAALQRSHISRAHLESNLAAAIVLGSASEYKRWLSTYATFLADQGDEERFEELCRELVGGVVVGGGGGDGVGEEEVEGGEWGGGGWTPEILGMSKRKLLRDDVLRVLGTNREMQRVVAKYRDILEDLMTD